MVTTIYYEFGPFRVDPIRRVLYRNEERIQLAAKPFDLLIELIQNAGVPVSKDVLMQSIWVGPAVLENTFDVTLSNLRKALGESAKEAHYVVTTPEGYLLAAEVKTTINGPVAESLAAREPIQTEAETIALEPGSDHQTATRWWRYPALAWTVSTTTVFALLVVLLIIFLRRPPATSPKARVPAPHIVIDGHPHEWKSIEPLLKDATGDGPFDPFGKYHGRLDFLAISATNDDKNLYLLLEFEDDYNGGIKVCLDTDLNASTGCHSDGVTNGAEYMIFVGLGAAGASLALADGRNCTFKEDYPGAIRSAWVGRFVEAAIPLDTLRVITPETTGVRIAAESIAPGKGTPDTVGPPATYMFQ